eukprot:1148829-Pelagomonas_calceolata.AAC.1
MTQLAVPAGACVCEFVCVPAACVQQLPQCLCVSPWSNMLAHPGLSTPQPFPNALSQRLHHTQCSTLGTHTRRWWASIWEPPTPLWQRWREASPRSSPTPRVAAPPPPWWPSPRAVTAWLDRCEEVLAVGRERSSDENMHERTQWRLRIPAACPRQHTRNKCML